MNIFLARAKRTSHQRRTRTSQICWEKIPIKNQPLQQGSRHTDFEFWWEILIENLDIINWLQIKDKKKQNLFHFPSVSNALENGTKLSVFKFCIHILPDVPIDEEHVADINEKKRYNPQILELKPNVHFSTSGQASHPSQHHHLSGGSPHHSSVSNQAYQPLKFRPTIEIKDFKPSYHSSQSHADVGTNSFTPSNHQQMQQKPTYKPGNVLAIKKPDVKKIKIVTPGLKHYATVKHVNRNDYANYFRSRASYEDQRDASRRLVQNMYRQSRSIVPQYAQSALNYGNL